MASLHLALSLCQKVRGDALVSSSRGHYAKKAKGQHARALYFNLVVFVLMNAWACLTFSFYIRFIVVLMASLV